MLKEWQFNILFFVGVGSAVFLLIGPEFGLSIAENPTALAGVGSILTYILTQKKSLTKKLDRRGKHHHERDDDDEEQDTREIRSVYDTENRDKAKEGD